ncbi:MAG: PIN domain-containing protein [Chloroflexota bacterium]
MTSTLVDSSFLYALHNAKDKKHGQALNYSEDTHDRPLIPDVVLPEVTFLLHREGGILAVTAFLRNFTNTPVETVALTTEDIQRAERIMTAYPRADLDFVDCAIMALAERLNIQKIATFDRRDFAMVRPSHCEYFELLP